jgi:hypothetical protein
MGHGGGPGREDGHVRAALLEQAHLILLDGFGDLVVGDVGIGRIDVSASLEGVCLGLAPSVVRRWRGGVVAVAIDNHRILPH